MPNHVGQAQRQNVTPMYMIIPCPESTTPCPDTGEAMLTVLGPLVSDNLAVLVPRVC